MRSAVREISAEDALRCQLELAKERVAIANERAAVAKEREAIMMKMVELAEVRATLCEARMSAMVSDADRVLGYANEAARCQLLVRDAEQREREEALRCKVLCQEAAQRVAYETERRRAAEEHAAGVEQYAVDTIEQKLKAVRHEAWMRVEADREALAKLQARICELESGSIGVLPRLPARVTAVKQREAATGRAVQDEGRLQEQDLESGSAEVLQRLAGGDIDAEQQGAADGQLVREEDLVRSSELEKTDTQQRYNAEHTAAVESNELGSNRSNVQPETVVEPRAEIVVRSYAATLRLPASDTLQDKKRRGNGVGSKLTCIRCGGCGHLHQQCEAAAKAVIWGIDWAKRRKHRKRWRQAAKRRHAVGVKTTGGALKEVGVQETAGIVPLTGSKRLEPDSKANGGDLWSSQRGCDRSGSRKRLREPTWGSYSEWERLWRMQQAAASLVRGHRLLSLTDYITLSKRLCWRLCMT
jgi:hypothetical protein